MYDPTNNCKEIIFINCQKEMNGAQLNDDNVTEFQTIPNMHNVELGEELWISITF